MAKDTSKELIIEKDPKSSISEAIKTIRTNLQFASVDGKCRHILVTSAEEGDGKSFIAANLAASFAQLGQRVLIVDCDMRKGRQHEIFGVGELGLSNLLIDDIKNFKSHVKETNIKKLSLLPRGIVPPNPNELILSLKMKNLVDYLGRMYDLVIWDGAPLVGLNDSLLMADLVDKIVLVCSYKKTHMESLEAAKKLLDTKFSKKIAGVVVNKMPIQNKYYYNERYY